MQEQSPLNVRWVLIHLGVACYFGMAIAAASFIASSIDGCLEEVADVCLKYADAAEDADQLEVAAQSTHHFQIVSQSRSGGLIDTRLAEPSPAAPFSGLKF